MKVIFRYLCACAFLLEVQSVFAQIETPIMGWSSWNTYRVNISDSLIKRQADAMVDQGLKVQDIPISMWMTDFLVIGMNKEIYVHTPSVFQME